MDTAEKIRFGVSVFGIAVLHFFGVYMLTFISGTTGGGTWVKILANVLSFPLSILPASDNIPPLVGLGAVILTSFLWAFAICGAIRYFTHR